MLLSCCLKSAPRQASEQPNPRRSRSSSAASPHLPHLWGWHGRWQPWLPLPGVGPRQASQQSIPVCGHRFLSSSPGSCRQSCAASTADAPLPWGLLLVQRRENEARSAGEHQRGGWVHERPWRGVCYGQGAFWAKVLLLLPLSCRDKGSQQGALRPEGSFRGPFGIVLLLPLAHCEVLTFSCGTGVSAGRRRSFCPSVCAGISA